LNFPRSILAFGLAVSLLFGVGVGASAQAQGVQRSDIVSLLQRLHELPGAGESYRLAGFDEERTEIMLTHRRTIMSHRGVAGFVADRLISAQSGQPNANQLGGVVQPLIDRGLPHLATKDQVYFLRVENTIMDALGTRLCGQTVKETVNPAIFARESFKVTARLNAPALREYTRILRQAAFTGLTKTNPPRISAAARERALEGFSAALVENAETDTVAQQLLLSHSAIARLSNKNACNLGKLFSETALNYEGPEKRTLIQMLFVGF